MIWDFTPSNMSKSYKAHYVVKNCQCYNFSYCLGQMFLLDRFFDGTFFTYGIEVMSFADRDQEDRIDPMIYLFPRYLYNYQITCQHK